jgi:hypothetical protein
MIGRARRRSRNNRFLVDAREIATSLFEGEDAALIFPIADLFGLDRAIAADIATLVAFLGAQPRAVYPNEFERREESSATSANRRAARTEAV